MVCGKCMEKIRLLENNSKIRLFTVRTKGLIINEFKKMVSL